MNESFVQWMGSPNSTWVCKSLGFRICLKLWILTTVEFGFELRHIPDNVDTVCCVGSQEGFVLLSNGCGTWHKNPSDWLMWSSHKVYSVCGVFYLHVNCGVKLKDRLPSKELRKRLGVDDIALILQQNRLRWYGHVLWKDDDDWVKKCTEYEVEGSRPRGRPKRTWKEVVREDCQAHNWIKRMPWTVANGERW